MVRLGFLTFLIAASGHVYAQHLFQKMDLKPEWQIYVNSEFKPFVDNPNTQTIYIWVNPKQFSGDRLLIESPNPFGVILAGEFVQAQTLRFDIPMDSLSELMRHGEHVLVGVHQPGGIRQSLSTRIMSEVGFPTLMDDTGPVPKPQNSSVNFVVSCFLLLTVFFVVLLGVNPKLTAHFFSLRPLLFQREMEESQTLSRITSGPNIVFYVFVSFLTAYVIVSTSPGTSETTYWPLSLLWLKTGAFVFSFFMIRAVVVTGFAALFGIRELARIQFFNFIRLSLLIILVLAILVTGYSVVTNASAKGYSLIFNSLEWVLAGWVVLCFLTLLRRVPFSVFHLFSYICLTELIPFFLVVNILYE